MTYRLSAPNVHRLALLLLIAAATMLLAAVAVRSEGEATTAKTGKFSAHQKAFNRNYYMYVPHNYTPRKRWPMIISAPGTFPFDSSPGTRDAWVDAADELGLIICCPDFETANGLLNIKADQGKLQRDNEAVMAIVREVAATYSIDPNGVAVTGWSGGGYPAHYIGLKNPNIIRAIIGRTANFSEDLVDDATARKARHIHVFCFFAKSDLAGIPEQNRRANFWYTMHGFLNFEIREIPGGHSKNNHLAGDWFVKMLRTNPTARIQASTLKGQAPLTVNFRALAADPDGKVTGYIWQFGDGGVSIQQSAAHTFSEAGTYSVFLTVTDNDGN
ncbi:MAG: PKD domain-containing protein, partial [Planctomycetes bacterium]|nr:PKD domain-containing protein [Planctomycetota bacterium]